MTKINIKKALLGGGGSMMIPQETKDWLTGSPIPYVRYNACLLFCPEKAHHKELLSDTLIQELIQSLRDWKDEVLKRHDAATLGLHRLVFLADLGIKAQDPGMERIINTILKTIDEQGIPRIQIEIPTVFGGNGKPTMAWMACDFPTILYALLKMGVRSAVTSKAVQALQELVDEDGLHCCGFMPKFRGPGKKSDICPYANLISAKALSEDKGGAESAAAQKTVEALLRHWQERGKKKYYLFGIGTEYKKLQLPYVWYNLLHVMEVVSRYEAFHTDKRFKEMMEVLLSQTDSSLRFKPESMYMAYKGRDFANKKEHSPTITLFTLRILKRAGIDSF